jgi:hypothetical protein
MKPFTLNNNLHLVYPLEYFRTFRKQTAFLQNHPWKILNDRILLIAAASSYLRGIERVPG